MWKRPAALPTPAHRAQAVCVAQGPPVAGSHPLSSLLTEPTGATSPPRAHRDISWTPELSVLWSVPSLVLGNKWTQMT